MKVLVCKNKHCHCRESEEVLNQLKKLGIEHNHSSCMDMCESGPNVFILPDAKLYGRVTSKRIDDVLKGLGEDLLYNPLDVYDEVMYQEYLNDPMHRRTVKLFRWHLDKHDDLSVASIREMISVFKSKYDVKGIKFTYPVKLALIKTIKGPDLPKLIHYLEKKATMKLLDDFLKKA